MAFEQFFYTSDSEIKISGEVTANHKKFLDDGSTLYINSNNVFKTLAIITESADGGILAGGTNLAPSTYFPSISGGSILGGHGFNAESRIVSGGALLSGKAIVAEADEEIGSGGIKVGGKVAEEPIARVGVLVFGSSVVGVGKVGEVKALAGGSADVSYIANITGNNGCLVNGDAKNIENISGSGGTLASGASEAAESASGGILLSGRATTLYDEIGSGGAILGGKAPNGTHDFGNGGILVDGSVIQRITQHIEVSGVILNGKAPEEPATSGGAKLSGTGFQTYNNSGNNGSLIDGAAIVGIEPPASGGILSGGAAIVGIEPSASGGALLGTGIPYSIDSFYTPTGDIVVISGESIAEQPDYSYNATGIVQVTQPETIYKKVTLNFVYQIEDAEAGTIVGNALVGKRFFGQSVPKFSFGKTPAKNEACRSFFPLVGQATVLTMTRTKTREWLEKLDEDDWQVVSFDPKKREVCILVENNIGSTTHLITVELAYIGNMVGAP